jgi:protein-tyrosine-phosphatase
VGDNAAPVSVLLVCTANICRSAFAEALARHLLGGEAGVSVSSAGIHGFLHQPMDGPMAAEVVRRGADPTYFRSRRLTMRMIDEVELVLTAEVAHRTFILDDRPAAFRRIFTLGQFARMLPDLSADLQGRDLLEAARRALKPARREDDVMDPFGRGPEAAAAAAERVESLLRAVLPRLVPSPPER